MNGFCFEMTPYEAERLLPQVAAALEKHTELESRRKMPGLWKLTDKLRAKREDGGEKGTVGKAFLRSAKKLLDGQTDLRAGENRVTFATLAMNIRQSGRESTEEVVYSDLERILETRDVYLLFFGERVLLLQKKDMTEGTPEDFRAFISARAQLSTVES